MYGIEKLLPNDVDAARTYMNSWFWCRKHDQPELGSWSQIGCIRVGPFDRKEDAEKLTVLAR